MKKKIKIQNTLQTQSRIVDSSSIKIKSVENRRVARLSSRTKNAICRMSIDQLAVMFVSSYNSKKAKSELHLTNLVVGLNYIFYIC